MLILLLPHEIVAGFTLLYSFVIVEETPPRESETGPTYLPNWKAKSEVEKIKNADKSTVFFIVRIINKKVVRQKYIKFFFIP